MPILFGSIVRTHGVPHTLLLTPQGWRVATLLPGVEVLSAQSWKTLEEAREALRIAVEASFTSTPAEA
jgi:hypothetical protein